jgi:hypothetical protein
MPTTLKKSQRVFSSIRLFGNFLERPLKLGDILFNDDGQHLIWGNIEDLAGGFSLSGKTRTSNKTDLKFTSESNVSVGIGGSANVPVASGEVQLKFNAKNSAFVSLKEIERTSIELGEINEELLAFWDEKGFSKAKNRMKYHFIAEVINAQSGTVIFSQEKGNTVVLKGKNNTPLTSISVIGSGAVEYVSNSKSTLEIISTTPIQPLYTAVRFRSNDNFEIVDK